MFGALGGGGVEKDEKEESAGDLEKDKRCGFAQRQWLMQSRTDKPSRYCCEELVICTETLASGSAEVTATKNATGKILCMEDKMK